jgi:hypothetical protein
VVSTWERKRRKYRVPVEKIAREKDMVEGVKWI